MRRRHLLLTLGLMAAIATAASFTGSAPDAPPRGVISEVAARGGWTWFNDPRAIHHDGRTFFAWITAAGRPEAAHYDHATRATSSPVRLFHATNVLEVDDHDNPALLRRSSDGRILAYYSKHYSTGQYVNVSTSADDASSWGAASNIYSAIGANLVTYMNPVELPDGTIRLYFRDHYDDVNPEWAFADSDDGVTFAGHTSLVRLTYVKVAQAASGKIHYVASDHPEEAATSVYHFYENGGNYYQSDGTLIESSLPLAASDLTEVYDGTSTDGWLWDIAMDGEDPVIAYMTYPTTSDHRANVARWSGSEWGSEEVVATGGAVETSGADPNYSGGIVIDRTDPRITYVSKKVGSDWQVFRYPGAVLLTSGSGKHIRPAAIEGRSGALVMYASTYTDYANYAATTEAGF